MARHDQPREDMMREATALVERLEVVLAEHEEPLVAGFRRDGAASFFFGPQAVYQFNSGGELRRAFLDDRLYKAEDRRLIQLTRRRTAEQVELVRHELSAAETIACLEQAAKRLHKLHGALLGGNYNSLRQIPTTGDLPGRVQQWLAALPQRISIADRPGVA